MVVAAVLVSKVATLGAMAVAATRERVTCRNMKINFILFLTFVVLFLQAKYTK